MIAHPLVAMTGAVETLAREQSLFRIVPFWRQFSYP
jgi:hypothetical protein